MARIPPETYFDVTEDPKLATHPRAQSSVGGLSAEEILKQILAILILARGPSCRGVTRGRWAW